MQTLNQLLSGQLKGAVNLKLSCGLTKVPTEIFELSETLQVLDLSGNNLNHLPEEFDCLIHLQIVFFSNNHFTEFPEILNKCTKLKMIGFKANKITFISEHALPPNLRWLILTDNLITSLPRSVGTCIQLQKLMLAGNKLTALPIEMSACVNLQLLRISANAIAELPSWLLRLPKLTWLSFSGNPCCESKVQNHNLSEISWKDLQIEEQLGEGASGIISKANWKGSKPVAVKVFKGEVTSDGFPADEMGAWTIAGSHDNLVKVLGKISEHPEQKQGLVFELIPSSYKNLGLPPDFDTCTRDTFNENTEFSLKMLIHIARDIASAAAHLHTAGLMHGDLYAHNILYDAAAHALLGDFGGATCYDKADSIKAFTLERLEVRAFGCLLEDVLNHLSPMDLNHKCVDSLIKLKQQCMHEDILQRPSFVSISHYFDVAKHKLQLPRHQV